MSKPIIVRFFAGSVIAIVAGLMLMFVAGWLAFASDALVLDGPDVVGAQANGWTVAMIVVGGVALIAIVGGWIGGLVSWIGALLDTAQLEDKTWFVLLLVLGLLSFGLVAMIAYVIAGPDGTMRPIGPRNPATQ
jgi:hypothetical protein